MLNTTAKSDSASTYVTAFACRRSPRNFPRGRIQTPRASPKSLKLHDGRGGGVRVRESDLAAFMHRLPQARYADNFYRRYVAGAGA